MARASTRWRRERGQPGRSPGSSRFSFQSIRSASALLELYFDVYARGQVELAQRVDSLLGRLEDVEQTFMSSNFKMLARFLRSEEHTSELQSHSDLVCRLLLEKKNRL